jgi:hypothetical protein
MWALRPIYDRVQEEGPVEYYHSVRLNDIPHQWMLGFPSIHLSSMGGHGPRICQGSLPPTMMMSPIKSL